eukprot:gene15399-6639_t
MAENIDYSDIVHHLRLSFNQGKIRPVEQRIQQLKQFLKMMTENKELFVEALHQDLRKPAFEATMMEYTVVVAELTKFIDNLPSWAAFQRTDADLMNKFNTCGIQYEPYGVALIIGAWNYPLLLLLQPLIGCIGAGNCAVLKPSELSPVTASLIESLVPRYLDEDCFRVIAGGKDETSALLRERFDYMFYTGGHVVGQIVMQAAAKYLTPVTLELGGKSPCYVDGDCNFDITARRIVWGKYVNCGQTCLAPDYILCTKETEEKLTLSLKKALKEFYGENPKESKDLARIINERHFQRIRNLINQEKVVIGGDVDEDEKYISPTVMTDVTSEDAVMKEEIFGPLLPIVKVISATEAVKFINKREKPLALYVFSKTQSIIDKFINETSSGAVCVNDSIVQAAVPSLPFGGIGQSGMGAYHGKFSFESFSHRKACLIKKQNLEALNAIRYPPYTDSNMKTACWFLMPSRNSKYMKFFFYFAVFGAVIYLLKSYNCLATVSKLWK